MLKPLIFLILGISLVVIGNYLRTPHPFNVPSMISVAPVVSKKIWDISESTGGVALYESARAQIGVVTEYDRSNGYYAGGEPPPYTGVCTDVISRAFS